VAITVTLAVAFWSLQRSLPLLPNPLELDLRIDPGEADRSDPLITSGRREAGDFLFIRHAADGRIRFGYETWGQPSLLSAEVGRPADNRFRLRIEAPQLTQIQGSFAPQSTRLRVIANGIPLFDLPAVDFHERRFGEIFFAVNPIGGTACGPVLRGSITLPDGRALHGRPAPLFGWQEKLHSWLWVSRWPAIGALLLGALTFWGWPREDWRALGPARLAPPTRRAAHLVWSHRHFTAVASLATLAFTWLITYGTLSVVAPETFGNFYDYQATSLLQGRLDVPYDAIGGEAFVHAGKNYGYFGITPALLRLPAVVFGLAFGELTRALMVAYFAGTLLATYLLLRTARRLLGAGEDPPAAWATWCLLGSVGLGSTVFFLGSRAYVYHEAILCGVMFALFAAWAALRHALAPEGRWWVGSLAAGVLSVHARPPTGLFALTLLAVVAALVAYQQRRTGERGRLARGARIAVACGLGVFSFNVLSYLKFETFEGCPLRLNVQYDAKRLARIDGKQFHAVNVPFMIDRYLLRPNFRLEGRFPFLFVIEGLRDDEWTRTKIDYHEPTLAFPYAMPGLVALAVLGGVSGWAGYPARRPLLLAVWAAGAPMTLAMFSAIAITQRYTADFCPLLITAAAFGVVALDRPGQRWAALGRAGITAAVLVSVLVTSALTVHYQGSKVWGVPDDVRARYAAWGRAVDETLTGPSTKR